MIRVDLYSDFLEEKRLNTARTPPAHRSASFSPRKLTLDGSDCNKPNQTKPGRVLDLVWFRPELSRFSSYWFGLV
jgi:hypothetical protein